ncbi:phage tail sheath subtilisin-like domain-containing protein [Pseudomonas sp. HR96]|uniref:phage tail sheath family protein n=1 Tax=Pseudomonas sp. HR96 TaxID=1027966 RepID=UPI002A7591DA|nr:phage tail sheath C-terminal domain-containing protein [Pseudomonas sp. HR96]WPO98646.1 phage tail sheath subtilisin-like domain-containing protein [Pseudomonas sp. HR96]
MPVTYTVPGVYVEESNLPLLSVPSGATAVPVFIGNFKGKDGVAIALGKCIEVASWFDFTEQFSTPTEATLAVTSVVGQPGAWTLAAVTGALDINWRCIQLYFDNGGGRCYILPFKVEADLLGAPEIIERYSDITLMCATVSTATSKAVYESLSRLQQEMGGLFLIADSKNGDEKPATVAQRTAVYYPGLITQYSPRPADDELKVTIDGAASPVTLDSLKTSNEALYGQIFQHLEAYAAANPVHLPASPAIAGVYCRTDANRGPWQAPAGASLNNVSGVERPVTTGVLDKLLENRINAIKAFAGEGVRVWGARTMVAPSTPLWLHIQVMRLFDAAARDIRSAMRVAVFMPNNGATWATVRTAIDAYLYNIWRQGGLKGSTAQEAYYVQVGHGLTMTDEDVLEGILNVNVGMAALRPAEFIEVVFSQVLSAA